MPDHPYNTVRELIFSGPHVQAEVVRNAKEFAVTGRAVVVNIGDRGVYVGESPRKAVAPLSSTVLVDSRIEQADAVLLLRTSPGDRVDGITAEPGWDLLGDLIGGTPAEPGVLPFPPGTPLWKSPQDHAATLDLAPSSLLKEPGDPEARRTFDIRVNLWFAPGGTDCSIHNRHEFIEVHTQVHGLGRMQKFREQRFDTLYEDVLMSPGYTTPDPFCVTGAGGTFVYPWHQYRADSDCLWLAVEYHPAPVPPGPRAAGTGTTGE